ncbi:hypothetical protein HK101_007696 [Irineochytrium annulatum]|nr:hypothetical protein HK101_007696 [Irineochytrium annulatum]
MFAAVVDSIPFLGGPVATATAFPRFVLVTDELRADGSFLLHPFLARALATKSSPSTTTTIRQGPTPPARTGAVAATTPARGAQLSLGPDGAVLVAIAHTLKHHDAIAKKLGYSLRQHPRFKCIDCFSHLHSLTTGPFLPTSQGPVQGPDLDPDAPFNECPWPADALRNLHDHVLAAARSLRVASERPTVVVDDLTTLLYAGAPASEVVAFALALRRAVFTMGGTLVMLAHDDKTTGVDRDLALVVGELRAIMDCGLRVAGLSSGHVEGVTGELFIKRGKRFEDGEEGSAFGAAEMPEQRRLLYHIAETGVRFFNPGHVPS